MDVDNLPMFRSGDFREFAISELGKHVESFSTKELLALLYAKAKDEEWRHDRWLHEDTCEVCSWTGLHGTVGPQWHITPGQQLYENPKVMVRRPNFLHSGRHNGWICIKCVREAYAR